MNDEYTTWEAAVRVAIARTKFTDRRHRVYSDHRVRGWAICPSRRWYVRELAA